MEVIYCKNCETKLGKFAKQNHTILCRSCANKGKNNPNYKNGSHLRTPKKCPICKNPMDSRSETCFNCFIQKRIGTSPTNKIDGRTTKEYYCIKCNKRISCGSGYYGKGQCISCANTRTGLPKCLDCGIELRGYDRKRCKKCSIIYMSGKNHPAYILGLNRIYPLIFNKELKKYILNRDNYICQLCYKWGNHVHHIDYDKKNNKVNNLITLCSKCHPKTNWNRKKWTYFFKNEK